MSERITRGDTLGMFCMITQRARRITQGNILDEFCMITQMWKNVTHDNIFRSLGMITHKRARVTWCDTPGGKCNTHKEQQHFEYLYARDKKERTILMI